MSHIIGAKEIPQIDREVITSGPLDIYIGVFFDGTNNNKVQSMIGQYFRRKEIFEKNKKKIKKEKDITNFDSFIKSGITKDDCKKLGLTDSDCDKLFGTSTTITNDFEKKIMEVDNSDNSYRWSSAAIEYSDGWNELLDNPVNKSDIIISPLSSTFINKCKTWINRQLENQIRKRLEYISGISKKGGSFPECRIEGAGAQNATYTNPAILDSLYKAGKEKNNIYYTIYVEGSGADNIIKDGGSNKKMIFTDLVGLSAGYGKTGVFTKCRKAVAKINDIINTKTDREIYIHFDIFGFSRGATTSRIFTYLINPNNDKIPESDYTLYTGNKVPFLKNNATIKNKEIRLLGLYDTVSSIGVANNFINKIAGVILPYAVEEKSLEEFASYKKRYCHEYNVDDYGLWSTINAQSVIHFCALDEYRENFALVDIESSIKKNGLEIFMPGCHTDIGGGSSLGQDDLKIINKKWMNMDEYVELFIEAADLIVNNLQKEHSVASTVFNFSASFLIKTFMGIPYKKQQKIIETLRYIKDNKGDLRKRIDTIVYLDEILKILNLYDVKAIESNSNHEQTHNKTSITKNKSENTKEKNMSQIYIYNDNKELVPIEISSFNKLGWIHKKIYYKESEEKSSIIGRAEDSIIKEGKTIVIDGTKALGFIQINNIGIYKYVKPGYSNVTLALMRDWALKKAGKYDLFNNIPIDFSIPNDLIPFYNGVNDCLGNIGRYRCVPSPEQYRKLRCKYLHFSMNEQFLSPADNKLVNGPQLDENGVITRRIYVGTKGEAKMKYMYQNKIDNNKIIGAIDIKIDKNEFSYLYASENKTKDDYKDFEIINSPDKKHLPQKQEIQRCKNQIHPGMFNINPSGHAYIDNNNKFHISRTVNYGEYPNDIDHINPGIFKSSSKKNK